jgi:hypothetical protein
LIRWFLEVLGLGVALTSMGWILGHLIAFAVLGRVLVGEDNKTIILAEIGLVSVGICCLAASYVGRLSGRFSD